MKEITIEQLAYQLIKSKEKGHPQPIFFLGAGASRSGNIPLAGEIIKEILASYSDNPSVRDLPEGSRTYASLMECLLPAERDELLKRYIDEAKINVTHIYLAQLLKEGFADYVLTVNFDNLMLRALALYNIFPATYDMAILKDLTTTAFKEKSVVYLHGQNHGLWLLNTPDELKKVRETVPTIFHSIKNKRPWVFIGYSGEDPIFDHLKELGRFDNGLYWVAYNDYLPIERVQKFLATPNTNAFLIKGYDSDSFMLKLNNELGLGEPNIVNKPFSALEEMLNVIVDIEDKEHFKGVKERLEISKRQVAEGINLFELGMVESGGIVTKILEIDLLKKEIINLIIKDKYDPEAISEIESKVKKLSDANLDKLLSGLFNNWGNYLGELANTQKVPSAEVLFREAFDKYAKAIEIKPDNHQAFYNWGTYLGKLAKTQAGPPAEALYHEAFQKFAKAIEIKPNNHEAFYNWGTYLGHLAKTQTGPAGEALYREAFEKFAKAIEIKPDYHSAFNNWGNYLGYLAKTYEASASEALYSEAFEKYAKAIEIKPDKHEAFYNWGNNLGDLAKTKNGPAAEALYSEAFEKYAKAIEIKPDKHEAFYSWGTYLGDLAMTQEGPAAEALYNEAFEKFAKAIEIKPDKHEAFNNWGASLGLLAKTLGGSASIGLYREAFEKYAKAIEIKPDYHEAFNNWGAGLGQLAKIHDGPATEGLYREAFEKYAKAVEIKPDYHEAFYNWGANLAQLAKTREGPAAEKLNQEAIEKFKKVIELGGECYNLACLFAINNNKKEALYHLAQSLEKKEIEVDFVKEDEDWKAFLSDADFIQLLAKYS